MARQPVVASRAEQLLGSAVVATSPVAGGEISSAVKLRLSSGRTAFLKSLTAAPPHFFATEAAGLRWLAAAAPAGGVTTPEVLGVADDCLIVDWIEEARPSAEAAAKLGRALAATHTFGGADLDAVGGFGAAANGYIGRLPLPNRPLPTWAEFWVERRIAPYVKVLRDKQILTQHDAATIESAASRTAVVVPTEAPARLHGDLWNGNVLWAQEERVVVVDPAAYAGHREVDLAMLALFGLPQLQVVMGAYQDVAPLVDGWEDRLAFHQVFPLLVHACAGGASGGTYAARAGKLAARFV